MEDTNYFHQAKQSQGQLRMMVLKEIQTAGGGKV
jgi:hypothetical protein